MKIGEFVDRIKTTKDTIRHYEDLQLIQPKRSNHTKEYGEKEIQQYQVIQELKTFGFTLKEIQAIFQLKNTGPCKDPTILTSIHHTLSKRVNQLTEEEKNIHQQRKKLQHIIKEVEIYL